jgi:hypothetical protein
VTPSRYRSRHGTPASANNICQSSDGYAPLSAVARFYIFDCEFL